MPRNPNKKRCKAKAKSTGERCKYWAVPGYDVCRFHIAGGGPPKKNRNAERHGFFGKIMLDDKETLAIMEEIGLKKSLDMIWENNRNAQVVGSNQTISSSRNSSSARVSGFGLDNFLIEAKLLYQTIIAPNLFCFFKVYQLVQAFIVTQNIPAL